MAFYLDVCLTSWPLEHYGHPELEIILHIDDQKQNQTTQFLFKMQRRSLSHIQLTKEKLQKILLFFFTKSTVFL